MLVSRGEGGGRGRGVEGRGRGKKREIGQSEGWLSCGQPSPQSGRERVWAGRGEAAVDQMNFSKFKLFDHFRIQFLKNLRMFIMISPALAVDSPPSENY